MRCNNDLVRRSDVIKKRQQGPEGVRVQMRFGDLDREDSSLRTNQMGQKRDDQANPCANPFQRELQAVIAWTQDDDPRRLGGTNNLPICDWKYVKKPGSNRL